MKKLPMIVAIVVSIFSAQGAIAQDELAINNGSRYLDYDEQHEYTEINTVDLPLALQEAAARDFTKLRIAEAYISKDYTYKVFLRDHNDNTKIVFASANGEWIEPNDNKS
ncbi:hypothetical protein U6A24_19075 [Aquimarina gracilis]|uniref:PepSY domain-containing protein n=1 Tax=Aquimarina gracilis TaxID=874422 RepID=A0ABU6A0H5_9FLAO|nr:hypothetical protein [Aquimarina gracilis]MEB3347587.1 hypothetical protein [Aquimarina gracilis]